MEFDFRVSLPTFFLHEHQILLTTIQQEIESFLLPLLDLLYLVELLK
jgi:hypothetical protein